MSVSGLFIEPSYCISTLVHVNRSEKLGPAGPLMHIDFEVQTTFNNNILKRYL